MLRTAIVSSIHFGDSNSTVKRDTAALYGIQVKLETDPIPSIEAANDCEEITTLLDSKEGKVRSKEVIYNVNLISHSGFARNCPINKLN